MMTKTVLAAAAATLALSAGMAQAQTSAQDWSGPYVGVFGGFADQKGASGETIRFDTNLDGGFGDTVRTAAGADAFSPGFCGGSNLTNAAPGGCRDDDDSDGELGVRAGWDMQFGDWVVGGVVDYSRLELQDSVTGFSTTPAAYTFTRKIDDLFAVRARGGYVFGADNLVYVTGGYARAGVKQSFATTNTANTFPTGGGGGDADGYQFGLGVERRVFSNMTVGVEWLRTSLKADGLDVRATGPAPATNPFILVNGAGTDFQRSERDLDFDTFRVTAAYRF